MKIQILFLFCGIFDQILSHMDYCSQGSYRSLKGPWRNGCPGYKLCEKGYYCNGEVKEPCPAGTYGDQEGLMNSNCSKICPEGYYCPSQTISPFVYPCGGSTVYCPPGTASPLPIPKGYFGIGSSVNNHVAIEVCPFGSYCVDGIAYPCPAGTYGAETGLATTNCSNPCPPGFYCPTATKLPYEFPCPIEASHYCPLGSRHPIPVALGYYVIKDKNTDPRGGYNRQELCPPGSYCIHGVRSLCPPGRFGSSSGILNASCEGVCPAGWYCPLGTISAHQFSCGNSSVYCPQGSSKPSLVSQGYFTSTDDTSVIGLREINHDQLRTSQSICLRGHYCQHGVMKKCPAGTYGADEGLYLPSCSGVCEQGYYCPDGSTSPQQHHCGGPAVYCPMGSKEPNPVSNGYFTVGDGASTRYAERRCIPGQYCVNGKRFYCEAGYWGGEFGQNISTCSGLCSPGYYCPEGSTSPFEVMCGDPARYCPEGSKRPLEVALGYYSIGGNVSTRSGQEISPRAYYALNGLLFTCPAGRYGVKVGENDPLCTGECTRGFYCPARSISPFMYPCGSDDVFCPPGSVAPIAVHTGFYTTFQWSEGCKPGTYRNYSLAIDVSLNEHSFYPTEVRVPPCELCPTGTYKFLRGDDLSLCIPCPMADAVSSADRTVCECTRGPGGKPPSSTEFVHFNLETGRCEILELDELPYLIRGLKFSLNSSLTRYEEFECDPGNYCVEGVKFPCPAGRYGENRRETNPLCTGMCPAGYFCPPGTSYPQLNICGGSNLYCPEGSAQPLFVPTGHYSLGTDTSLTRTSTLPCPPGSYCQEGIAKPCPRGRYSSSSGTVSSSCEGECDPGYYCSEGSNSSRQYPCGNYSVYCPRGSYEPHSVHNGFYCDLTGDTAGADRFWDPDLTTCSVELPCEPGSYCLNGNRNLCPPGRFGWRYGLNSSDCSGLCAAGYYCPSYLEPQPQAPPWTVWPRAPQLTAFAYKCGGVGYYCPAGTWYPQIVNGGYYSVGGDRENTTRRAQEICPKGSYCINGIIQPCPAGRYGNELGLTDITCSGYCPAGYYCPTGTPDPIPCPPTAYSLAGSGICNYCPDTEAKVLPCQDSMTCCFRGSSAE